MKVDAKVISEGDESSLQVRGKTLSKVDYIIADKFASIKLVVWEKTIHVDVNKSYSFTNIMCLHIQRCKISDHNQIHYGQTD